MKRARSRILKCMVFLCIMYLLGSVMFFFRLLQKTKQSENNAPYKLPYEDDRPLLVIGIYSSEDDLSYRNAQRKTWITHRDAHGPYQVKAFFLLDVITPKLSIEQTHNNDILFLNVSSAGVGYRAGLKLHLWFKYVVKFHPDAELVLIMNDDVALCVPEVFLRLQRIQSKMLYYGYITKDRCIDDMFIAVGNELVRRIADRVYCGNKETCTLLIEDYLIEKKNTGRSLCNWLEVYSDYEKVGDNPVMQYLYGLSIEMEREHKDSGKTFCEKYILHNKADVSEIYNRYVENKRFRANKTTIAKTMPPEKLTSSSYSGYFKGEVVRPPSDLPVRYPFDYIIKHHPSTRKNCEKWAVFYQHHKAKPFDVSNLVAHPTWCLVIVGDDQRGHVNFSSKNFKEINNECVYLSLELQYQLYPDFAKLYPKNNLSRKNLGYIYAIEHGAKFIWDVSEHVTETGFPFEQFEQGTDLNILTMCPFFPDFYINPYECFGILEKPRGFLNTYEVSQPRTCINQHRPKAGIIQFIDMKNPDADLSNKKSNSQKSQMLDMPAELFPLLVPHAVLAPINGHSTVWSEELFPFLFLPSTVSVDVADIWRGYIAQLLLQEIGMEVYFYPLQPQDDRSRKDFLNHYGYSKELRERNDLFLILLQGMKEVGAVTMTSIYEELYIRGYIEKSDIFLIHLWRKMLFTLGAN